MDFNFKKKENQATDRIPKKKGIRMKGAKRIVLGGLVVVLLSGVVAFIKASAVSTHVSQVENSVLDLKKELNNEKGNMISFTPEIKAFMDRFITEYINIPNDDEAFKKRSATLTKEYYADGLSENETSFTAKRTLKDETFIALKNVDNVPVASYQVTYEIETPTTKKVQEKHKNSKGKETTITKEVTDKEIVSSTQVINIPFTSKNDSFCVTAYPYFTEPLVTKAKEGSLSYDEKDLDSVDSDTENKVQSFVTEFLTKYCESSSSDMAYMMDNPEGLNGNFTLDEVKTKAYKDGDRVKVKADVSLKDKNTSIIQKEQLTLDLTKKSDKFYVKKLSHTWKE